MVTLTTFLIVRNRVKYAAQAAVVISKAKARASSDILIKPIIVDHASEPEAAAQIVKLAKEHGFEHRRYDESLSAYAHWNRVMLTADTEWVHLHHDDDVIDVDFFSEFMAVIREAPEAKAFACPYVTTGSNGRVNGATIWDWDRGIVMNPETIIRHRCPIACIGFVIKSDLFRQVGGYDEKMSYAADWKFYWKVIHAGKFAVTERPLARYRVHEGSLTSMEGASLKSVREDLELLNLFSEDSSEPPDYRWAWFKIHLGLQGAASNRNFPDWMKFAKLGSGLNPSFRDFIRILYSLRRFLTGSSK